VRRAARVGLNDEGAVLIMVNGNKGSSVGAAARTDAAARKSLNPGPCKAENWIIGMADGYRWEQLGNFVESWQGIGSPGRLCLFHGRLDRETRRHLVASGVVLSRLPRLWLPRRMEVHHGGRLDRSLAAAHRFSKRLARHFPALSAAFERRLMFSFGHVANLRFWLAYDLLARLKLRDDAQVLLTDVRDVIFQRSPFEEDPPQRVRFFEESKNLNARECESYGPWLSNVYGEAFLDRASEAIVCCCAVVLGPARAVMEYLERFRALMKEGPGAAAYQFGFDSAAHNLLALPEGQFQGERVSNPNPTVVHLGAMSPEEFGRSLRVDPEGRLRTADGALIALIHQYDRHPEWFADRIRN
jgi:hypothetical protein